MSTATSAPTPPALSGGGQPRGSSARTRGLWVIAWIIAMVAIPWLGVSDLWMGIGIFTLIASIGTLGLQILMGFTGQISLGHAAFLAVGAYTSAWLGVEQGLPFWVWLPAAGLVSGVVGALFAPIAVRIRGLYLAVATLGLVFIGVYIWETWVSFTGGTSGRQAAPVEIGGQNILDGYWVDDTELLDHFQAWWYFILIVLLIAIAVTWNIKNSRLGRAMMAVRERDIAAGVVGIPVTRIKVIAFAISSAFAGVAGALLASYLEYFTPVQWGLMLSIEYIAMLVIGGMISIPGAILGAFFFRAMPEITSWLAGFIPFIATESRATGGVTAPLLAEFIYGLAIVLVLIFEPRGLSDLLRRIFVKLGSVLRRKDS